MSHSRLLRAAAIGSLALTAGMTAANVVTVVVLWQHIPAESRSPGQLLLAPVPLEIAVVGCVIALRRPRNPIGWIFCLVGFTGTVNGFGNLYGSTAVTWPAGGLPFAEWAAWLGQSLWAPAYILVPGLVPLLFPDGHLPSPRWRPVVWLNLLVLASTLAVTMLNDPLGTDAPLVVANPLHTHLRLISSSQDPLTTAMLVSYIGLFILGGASLVVRWRRASTEQRQQIKWFVYSIAILVATLVAGLAQIVITQQPSSNPWIDAVSNLATAFVPIAIGIAILRHRLYDIDVVISRTLVFFFMAAFITVVYVGVVAGLGHFIGTQGRPNLLLSVLATVLVATAFQPLRERLERLANRLVYGRRAKPYEVMAELSHRLAGAPSLDEVLPSLAQAAAEASGSPAATSVLYLSGGGSAQARWPASAPTDEPSYVEPVSHLGEQVGELRLEGGEPPGPAARRLLAALAGQAGVVLRNLRLTAELEARLDQIRQRTGEVRASRQRIVAAAQVQRRRLEKEVTEGVGRRLLEIDQRLDAAAEALGRDPEQAAALLDALAADLGAALDELRELARGIFPPLLADRGLATALAAHVRKLTLPVEVKVREPLAETRLDPRHEAAAYFCCVGAVQSAVRLRAREASLELALADGSLVFSVKGWGLERQPSPEDGAEMLDRIEALGGSLRLHRIEGGLELVGRIPLQAPPAQVGEAASQLLASRSGPNSDLGTNAAAPHSSASRSYSAAP